MTQLREDTDQSEELVISEALALIDKNLAQLLNRELMSTDEVSDLLLDVRSLLTTPGDGDDGADAEVGAGAPVGA